MPTFNITIARDARSRFFPGLARAMAAQWSGYVVGSQQFQLIA